MEKPRHRQGVFPPEPGHIRELSTTAPRVLSGVCTGNRGFEVAALCFGARAGGARALLVRARVRTRESQREFQLGGGPS